MIITSDIRVTYRGNGQTTEFPFAFPFYDADYICVKIKDELTGLVTKLDADYFVDTNTNTVIYPGYPPGEEPPQSQQPPILPETSTITIYRNTEISQLIDLGSKYPLPIIEQALDKITEILQELKDNVDRSVKVDETSTETPDAYLQEIRTSTARAVESKLAAAASEAAALASQQAAAASENNAAASAAAALTSQQAAATSETNAAASAAAAARSATDLETAVTTATTKAAEALASQQAAATSATAAATSAANASNSASAAAGSATEAAETAASIDHHAGYRQASTAYSDGAMATHHALPYGWYLEATTGGITSASDLVITSPAIGDTVTDGTVVWTIRKIGSGGDGVPLGAIIAYSANGELPSGYLLCDGAAVSRTMFPDLFAAIGTTYGAGDGSTTFNVPDYNAAERFAQGSTVAGTVKQAGLPNIVGETVKTMRATNEGGTGALSLAKSSTDTIAIGSGGNVTAFGVNIDASLSNPIYGASNTVQPPALTARYIIKAFDGQTPDSALIDITQYAADLANKADRSLSNLTQAGEDHFLEQDFTIIYPNGGSEASPANVATNSRYVEANPFPGYYVNCVAEIQVNNMWRETNWIFSSDDATSGTFAGQIDSVTVGVVTGNWVVSSRNPSVSSQGEANLRTAPCRVKVWKVGKIPTA